MQEDSSEKIQAAVHIIRQAMARIAAISDALHPSLTGSTLGAVAERLYCERRRRDEHFPPGLFGEPAWDLLLALFVAREDGREMNLRQASEAAGVTPAAGRTLVAKLERVGLVVRQRSQCDRRRHSVFLTDRAIERLNDYLATLL